MMNTRMEVNSKNMLDCNIIKYKEEKKVSEEFIGDVEEYEILYEHETGKDIIKLSNWNSNKNIGEEMIKMIPFFEQIKTVDYIFSYELKQKIKNELLMKFGSSYLTNDIVVTPSGSLSIYNVINFLKQKCIKSMALLAPVYFTVPYVCENLGINYDKFYLDRDGKEYFLKNCDIELCDKYDAIWITNPVYCTGVYYTESFVNYIQHWIDQGKYIIFDESLSLKGKELIRYFNKYENVISICSPHKSLCINGNKFSAIIMSKRHIPIFNAWVDIISGCLSISNLKAIYHFISDKYDVAYKYFNNIVQRNYISLEVLCKKYSVDYDKNIKGCFMSLYFPDLRYNALDDEKVMKYVFMKTGTSFIPGSRNSMNPDFGLTFRINLSRITYDSIDYIERLIKCLKYEILNVENLIINNK